MSAIKRHLETIRAALLEIEALLESNEEIPIMVGDLVEILSEPGTVARVTSTSQSNFGVIDIIYPGGLRSVVHLTNARLVR